MLHKEKSLKRWSWLLPQQLDEWWLFWGPPVFFCGSSHIALKKKKKCETIGLISLVGSTEPSVLRIRGPQSLWSTPERIKRNICLLLWLVPVVFCVFWSKLVLRMICEGVLRERFFLIDQSSVWYVSGAGWNHRRNLNLFVTDWIGNQLSCVPFCYDTEYKSERSITR